MRTRLFIAGEWRDARDRPGFSVENSAIEEKIGEAVQLSAADTADAIATASAAFEPWRHTDPWVRSSLLCAIGAGLRAKAETIAATITRETGKPLRQALGEVATAANYFDWLADEAQRIRGETLEPRAGGLRLEVRYEPVGVAAVLASWNFPVNLPARKIAAALAAGCTVICKPSEEAPASTAALFAWMDEAGLPRGVANLLLGHHDEILPALMASETVRKISFTGSTAVGKSLMRDAAATVKRLGLELGGHAAAIVCADADVVQAARDLVEFKFRNAGQICISPSRFYVRESVSEVFLREAVTRARALRISDGYDPTTDLGPLINRRRFEAVAALVAEARGTGVRILSGGGRPSEINRGHFFEPTFLVDLPADASILHEEPFGSAMPVMTFRALDEAIERANALECGLANYPFATSLADAHDGVARLRSGMVAVNNTAVATVEAPFGGVKQSGFRSEGGSAGIDEYLVQKFTKIALPRAA